MAKSRKATTRAEKPKAKARSKANGAKKQAAPKESLEQLSDRERQRLVNHHLERVAKTGEVLAAAKAADKKAYDLADKEGVTRKMLKKAAKANTPEGAADLQADIQETLDMARYVNSKLGEQLNLFPKQSEATTIHEDGRVAALAHRSCIAPTHLPPDLEQRWLAGWHAGNDQVNAARQSSLDGFKGNGEAKPVGDVAKGVVEQAAARSGIGEEAANSLSA
jgi:uncharacterized protein YaaR (DUF327 family)